MSTKTGHFLLLAQHIFLHFNPLLKGVFWQISSLGEKKNNKEILSFESVRMENLKFFEVLLLFC